MEVSHNEGTPCLIQLSDWDSPWNIHHPAIFWVPQFMEPPKWIQMAVCQNLVPLVNIKIAGKWMFIPLKMVLIGIDPYPNGQCPRRYVSFLRRQSLLRRYDTELLHGSAGHVVRDDEVQAYAGILGSCGKRMGRQATIMDDHGRIYLIL